jgi:hypothetical protein
MLFFLTHETLLWLVYWKALLDGWSFFGVFSQLGNRNSTVTIVQISPPTSLQMKTEFYFILGVKVPSVYSTRKAPCIGLLFTSRLWKHDARCAELAHGFAPQVVWQSAGFWRPLCSPRVQGPSFYFLMVKGLLSLCPDSGSRQSLVPNKNELQTILTYVFLQKYNTISEMS